MRTKIITYTALLAAFMLALGLVSQKVILAQAAPQLTSKFSDQPLPLADPASSVWDRAAALDIPLTSQRVAPPSLLEASVSSVKVRTLNDGAWIAFLLEWTDATRDAAAIKPDQFRDAAALQFPVNKDVPGACMGVRGQTVNIWHWKADWQEDIDKGFQDMLAAYPNFYKDYYPFVIGEPPFHLPKDFNNAGARTYLAGWSAGNILSDPVRVTPVETARAMGFSTITSSERQNVLGRGVWQDGKWRVTIARPLFTGEKEEAQFKAGDKSSVAFAVWNGSKGDVGAKKQLSTDIALTIEGPASRAAEPAAREPAREQSAGTPVFSGFSAAIAVAAGAAAGIMVGIIIAMYFFRKPGKGVSR